MAIQGGRNEKVETGIEPSVMRQRKKVNKALHQYLRWAIAGGRSGPSIPETMVLLGRDVTLRRLKEATSQRDLPEDSGSVQDAVSNIASSV